MISGLNFSCISYRDHSHIAAGISRLLQPGPLHDAGLDAAIRRLQACHDAWMASYPLGLWSEGLYVTHDMRLITETYLPLREIRKGFRQLYRSALRITPVLSSCPVHQASSWLDLLPLFYPHASTTNPARLLQLAAGDSDFRCRMLFAMFLPARYGCGFRRYPSQLAYIRNRLMMNRERRSRKVIRCLDAASGTGEGAYDLAQQLLGAGYLPEQITVHGSTREPFELFAGAHGYFPHDRIREAHFRDGTRPLFDAGAASRITFMQGDVLDRPGDGGAYDLVVCNGLIGGPLLHAVNALTQAVAALIGSLAPGGVLCIADRFHDGWKRRAPGMLVRNLLLQSGMEVSDLPEGLVAIRSVRE